MESFTEIQMDIINSAIELIAEKGIQQLTIKNLAGKLGRTEGAIYRHFERKIDILLGILELFKENKKLTAKKIQEQDVASCAKLKRIFEQHFQQFADNPAMAAVVFSEEIFQNEKQLADNVFSIMKETQQIIIAIIEKGQESGEIRGDIDPEELTLIVMGALRLLVTHWRLSQYSFDLREEGARLWASIEQILKT